MYISVNITNFKSIKGSTAKLPFFGAIVGKNAAGKTNLIQAIRFIRDLATGATTAEAQKSISLIPNELFNEGSTEFTVDATIKLKDDSQYLLKVRVELTNGSVKPPVLVISHESLFKIKGDHNNDTIYTRDKDNLKDKNNLPIPLSVDSNKLALSVYKNPEIPDTELVKEEFAKTVIPDIESLNSSESLATDANNFGYENLANTIVGLHHNQQREYDEFQEIIRKLLPHYSSLVEIPSKVDGEPRESTEKESYLVVLEETDLKKKLSMQSVSSGDLKTLFLIATSLSMQDHSTLIVEEIENGMHPKRIVDLLDHLATIARIKKMQILFTTHSPVVINSLSPTNVLLTAREDEKGTLFTLLEDSEQITSIKKYLQEGGNLTDYLFTSKY